MNVYQNQTKIVSCFVNFVEKAFRRESNRKKNFLP